MVWISESIGFGLLTWLSICDLRSRKVPVIGILCLFLTGLVRLLLLDRNLFFIQCLMSIWVLLSLFLADRASNHGIGGGDVFILACMPFWRTRESFLWAMLLAFLGAAVYGLLRFGLKGGRERFPFVPWIALGFGVAGLHVVGKG